MHSHTFLPAAVAQITSQKTRSLPPKVVPPPTKPSPLAHQGRRSVQLPWKLLRSSQRPSISVLTVPQGIPAARELAPATQDVAASRELLLLATAQEVATNRQGYGVWEWDRNMEFESSLIKSRK